MKMVSFCYTTDKVLSEFYYNLLQEIIIYCFYLGLKLFELQSYYLQLAVIPVTPQALQFNAVQTLWSVQC